MFYDKVFFEYGNKSVFMECFCLDNVHGESERKPSVIICPGGFYAYLSKRESQFVATSFLNAGYNAFILNYSVYTDVAFPNPFYDLARAMAYIRENSDRLNCDVDKIAIAGFSAGGHLVTAFSSTYPYYALFLGYEPELIKPNCVIGCYPFLNAVDTKDVTQEMLDSFEGLIPLNELKTNPMTPLFVYKLMCGGKVFSDEEIARYTPRLSCSKDVTPPTFLWISRDDELIDSKEVLRYASALANEDIVYELHIFDGAPHGMSMANSLTENEAHIAPNKMIHLWFDLALDFLSRHM